MVNRTHNPQFERMMLLNYCKKNPIFDVYKLKEASDETLRDFKTFGLSLELKGQIVVFSKIGLQNALRMVDKYIFKNALQSKIDYEKIDTSLTLDEIQCLYDDEFIPTLRGNILFTVGKNLIFDIFGKNLDIFKTSKRNDIDSSINPPETEIIVTETPQPKTYSNLFGNKKFGNTELCKFENLPFYQQAISNPNEKIKLSSNTSNEEKIEILENVLIHNELNSKNIGNKDEETNKINLTEENLQQFNDLNDQNLENKINEIIISNKSKLLNNKVSNKTHSEVLKISNRSKSQLSNKNKSQTNKGKSQLSRKSKSKNSFSQKSEISDSDVNMSEEENEIYSEKSLGSKNIEEENDVYSERSSETKNIKDVEIVRNSFKNPDTFVEDFLKIVKPKESYLNDESNEKNLNSESDYDKFSDNSEDLDDDF